MTVEVTEQVVRVEVVAGPTITVTETVPRVTETGPAQVTVQETVNQVVVAAPETVVVTEEVVRVVDIGVTDPLLTVKEGGVVVDSAVSVLDFIEPDAVLITSSPAGEANIDMSRYALLAGRPLTTNDLILTTSAATGTLYGSSDPAGKLSLSANQDDPNGILVLSGDSPHATLYLNITVSGTLGVTGLLTASGGVKTGVIYEATAAAGVNIDTALINDGSFHIPPSINLS